MSVFIRKPHLNEFSLLSDLVWKSFYYAQKDITSIKGMEHFRDLISLPVLQLEFLTRNTHFLCACKKDVPVGVIAYRGSHVVLLFVGSEFQHMGIGTQLLLEFLKRSRFKTVSVNAGMAALSFYQSLGFIKNGAAKEEEGLTFQPMMAEREVILNKLSNTYNKALQDGC